MQLELAKSLVGVRSEKARSFFDETDITKETFYNMTLKEIGEIEGISGTRVRQIMQRALRKLQHPKNSKILKDFIYDL